MDDSSPPPLAKLTRPRLKSAVVRERLFEFMDEARAQPVVWVCAPPGAGKTTLVGSYLEARTLPHLWYQLDAGDGDVATCFHYLEIAAQTLALPRHNIQSAAHHLPLPHFTPDHLPSLGLFTQRFFEALFTRFTSPAAQERISVMGAGGTRAVAALVLDNYQNVPPDSPLHALLAEALTQVPQGVNVVILSRAEPPAAYARLRANGAVAWLGYEQLKLTRAEASTIAKGRASKQPGDNLTPAIIEKLCLITHGWAAGLTLLLEHWRATGAYPPPSLLADTATPQVVFDYFAGEVFQRFNTVQRNILVQAVLLPDMDAGAVRDLTGDARAPEILANLARRNYFTQVLAHGDKQARAAVHGVLSPTALTHPCAAVASGILPPATLAHPCAAHQEESTYRFHPLFRAFLLNQAQHTFAPEHLAELQRRAARVLEDRGNSEDAIDLLHQVGDWDNAARLIVTHAPELAMSGRLQSLDTWIGRLPAPFVDRSPWLLYWLSQCRLGFDPAAARDDAKRAYALFEIVDDAAGLYLTWATVTSSYILECMNFGSSVKSVGDRR